MGHNTAAVFCLFALLFDAGVVAIEFVVFDEDFAWRVLWGVLRLHDSLEGHVWRIPDYGGSAAGALRYLHWVLFVGHVVLNDCSACDRGMGDRCHAAEVQGQARMSLACLIWLREAVIWAYFDDIAVRKSILCVRAVAWRWMSVIFLICVLMLLTSAGLTPEDWEFIWGSEIAAINGKWSVLLYAFAHFKHLLVCNGAEVRSLIAERPSTISMRLADTLAWTSIFKVMISLRWKTNVSRVPFLLGDLTICLFLFIGWQGAFWRFLTRDWNLILVDV